MRKDVRETRPPRDTAMNTPHPTPLVVAVAQAQNTGKVLEVVDESLRRAAEAREERERVEAERREKEARDHRVEQAKRQEEESARRLTERNERVAEEIAARDAARRAVAEGTLRPLDLSI
jgi:DNA anti-recombination protein RmuC